MPFIPLLQHYISPNELETKTRTRVNKDRIATRKTHFLGKIRLVITYQTPTITKIKQKNTKKSKTALCQPLDISM